VLAHVGNLVHSVYVFHPPPRADLAPRRVCVISSALTLSWYLHHGRCAAVAGSGRDVTLPLTLALGSRKDDHTCEAAGRLGPHPAAAGNTGRCLGSRGGAAALVAPAPGVHSTGRLAAHRRRADAGDCRAAGARPGLAGGAATAGHPGVTRVLPQPHISGLRCGPPRPCRCDPECLDARHLARERSAAPQGGAA